MVRDGRIKLPLAICRQTDGSETVASKKRKAEKGREDSR